MNNWQQTEIFVGILDKNKVYEFQFIKTSECKTISLIKPSCDCTELIQTDTGFKLKYTTPSQVSPELIMSKVYSQNITKRVDVYYVDQTIETLSFTLTIQDDYYINNLKN